MADGQLCLVCDGCGAEYRGKPSETGHPQRGYDVLSRHRLVADALERGWVGEMKNNSKDYCPNCKPITKG